MKNRIACIQMTSSEDFGQNLITAQGFIHQAVEEGAEMLVLPENFALMGLDQADKLKHSEQMGHGPIQDFLSSQAAEHKMWIIGGTVPIAVPDATDKVYATSLVYNDEGECVAHYDKIHLFDVTLPQSKENYFESKFVKPGKETVVVDSPFGKLGLAVCYDVRFPEMFRAMQKQGAEIFMLPSAFTYRTGAAHWDILVRSRAIENLSYVVAACQTGQHTNARRTYGHSMIVNPWGEVQVCLPDNPGVIISEINLDFLREIRQDFPVLQHRVL